jgi:hypothetical protein
LHYALIAWLAMLYARGSSSQDLDRCPEFPKRSFRLGDGTALVIDLQGIVITIPALRVKIFARNRDFGFFCGESCHSTASCNSILDAA